MEKHVTIDLKDPANASELEEAEVGDCVYLRVVEKTGNSIVGTVEQIEPMDEDMEGDKGEELSGGKDYGKVKGHAKGVKILIAAV